MSDHKYNEFPTMEEIKRDYEELMEIIKNIRTIEQAKEVEKKFFTIEINGMSIDDFVNGIKTSSGERLDNRGTNNDIEWIRYESYGCLSYIYDRFDGKPMFDVWSGYCDHDFIQDITIDDLTEELYESAKTEAIA